ncbi:DUF3888 domain-containing protein [Fictibacillus phosphorivorans]|uniref:DUF3888 domain-containing protein n=1 Tax=Fictibacillus phosphorivorans TaxID=1221500 RepID=UPI001293541A|nr:DUF3888 domain-containing protein [Fictibacillus phosphorivorans]MQR97594.1 DUF3888 domain-containing protein [Fictibacillus phosphorivorans]
MKKLYLIFFFIFFFNNTPVFANQKAPSQEFINKYYFNVDLKGVKDTYFFREFPFYNKNSQVSPLGKVVLSVLQGDLWTWVREPMIYIKEDIAYIHAVKEDGLNLLYTLKKEDNVWKVVKIEKKKLSTIDSKVMLEKAFLRAIGTEILNATKTYYGEPRLFQSERVVNIVRDEFNDKYYVTVQIVTYEGPIMPPYGFDTITLRIPDFKVIKYEHKDVTDIGNIPLETH